MNNVLLVTGSSSDVGVALVSRIGDNYDKVLCHYRSASTKIEELKARFGDKIIPLQADLSDYEQTVTLAKYAAEHGGNHFVHLPAAASAVNIRFAKTDWDYHFQDDINISLRSAVLICRAILPQMTKQKRGKIVFMLTSFIIANPTPAFSSAYMTVKSGLYGLMKALAVEYAGKGISINGVSPSMMDTKFLAAVPDIAKQISADKSPLKRLLAIDDVVPIFEYLLSFGADCITGQNIAVTAGG
jgi:3-oxoacyl-[acyl-carrier protein] reductase